MCIQGNGGMSMYKLIIIWYTGEKETYDYTTREEAEKAELGMRMVFGNQIEWSGISERRYGL